MAPKATGSVETYTRADGTKYYRARVRLEDGTRERVDIPEKYCYSEERRAVYAAAVQEREDERGELLKKKQERIAAKARATDTSGPETLTKYRERLNAHRAELGKSSGDASAWKVWIVPHLGALPMATLTREDIERFRDLLDAQIATHKRTEGAEGISAKRALNVWSELTTTFESAVNAKRRDLRVRTDNPCANVLPPEKGDTRRKTFVYPSELAAVLACLDVPLEWREVYAIGAYLYLRPGELHALTWGDVDLEAGVVHVSKAWDVRAGEVKAPKTANGMRDVPIPAALVALLRRMRDGREPSGLVTPIVAGTPESKRAPKFLRALRAAGITRPRLFENTATTMGVNFRSLRDSGITWLAISGVDLVKIQRRAGHDDPKTSLDYVKQAEDLSGGTIGEPFGPIPAATLDGIMGQGDEPPTSMGRRPRYQPAHWANDRAKSTSKKTKGQKNWPIVVEAAGVEPASESALSGPLRA